MLLLKDLLYVFYPELCVNCTSKLLRSEQFLCVTCLHDLPIIEYNEVTQKMLQAIFYGKVPIQQIYSFLYYSKKGITQQLIHALKYKGMQRIGYFFGEWMGHEIKALHMFDTVDCIVPVPLHSLRKRKRGYNQITVFGERLSEHLGVAYCPEILIRSSSTKTQTLKERFERFVNANSKFKLTDLTYFEGKHVLLIDDVVTTGATLTACSLELLKTPAITISICTIAYTE